MKKEKSNIFYLVDMRGNLLEASDTAGYWECVGISNIEVLKHCLGLKERKLYLGSSQVTFKSKEVKL